MSETGWVSLIALIGSLVLVGSAFRARRIDAKRTIVMALAWGAIILLVAAVFTAIGH